MTENSTATETIEREAAELDEADKASVIDYIKFLKFKRAGNILLKRTEDGNCWTRADSENAVKEWREIIEEMRTCERTGKVERNWTREELHERR